MNRKHRSVPQAPDQEERDISVFDSCEYARLLGMKIIDVWHGGARVIMDAEGKRNPFGFVHGAALFSLADHAFSIAANAERVHQVALTAIICYFSPARGPLTAVARKKGETYQYSYYEIEIIEREKLVAMFEGIGFKTEEPGL